VNLNRLWIDLPKAVMNTVLLVTPTPYDGYHHTDADRVGLDAIVYTPTLKTLMIKRKRLKSMI